MILLRHKECWGGIQKTGKLRQIEVTENSRVNGCSTRRVKHASCSLFWYSKTSRVYKFFMFFFNHALPNLKIRPESPDCRVDADWLKCAAPQTYFTLSSVRYPICHTIPAHLQQRLLSGQPKAGFHSEQNRHWFVDTNCYKEFIWILNKPLNISVKPVPGVEPGTDGFSVFKVYCTRFLGFTTPNETCCPYQKLISIFQDSHKNFRAYPRGSGDESPPYFDQVSNPLFLLPNFRDELLRFDFELQEIFRPKYIRQ